MGFMPKALLPYPIADSYTQGEMIWMADAGPVVPASSNTTINYKAATSLKITSKFRTVLYTQPSSTSNEPVITSSIYTLHTKPSRLHRVFGYYKQTQ